MVEQVAGKHRIGKVIQKQIIQNRKQPFLNMALKCVTLECMILACVKLDGRGQSCSGQRHFAEQGATIFQILFIIQTAKHRWQ